MKCLMVAAIFATAATASPANPGDRQLEACLHGLHGGPELYGEMIWYGPYGGNDGNRRTKTSFLPTQEMLYA